MRIAIVQESLDPQRGGAERSTREMAEALAQLDQDVTVVSSGAEHRTEQRAVGGGVLRVEQLACNGGKLSRTRQFVDAAQVFCDSGVFDIVQAVSPIRRCDVYQPRGGVYVDTIERSIAMGTNVFSRALKRIGRRLHRRQQFLLRVERDLLSARPTPIVAAVSDFVRRQTLKSYPALDASRVRVVFNGVALSETNLEEESAVRKRLRAQLHIEEQTPLILFVAHNFRLKGLRELIHALARLATTNDGREPRLLVVGRDDPTPYKQLSIRVGVESRVIFQPAASQVGELFAAADVLAHPTWYDPCSRVVLEAIAAGLPVVTTRDNGAGELIPAIGVGEVINSPADIAALTDALNTCLQPSKRDAARSAASRARELVSMRRHATELLELFREIRAERNS